MKDKKKFKKFVFVASILILLVMVRQYLNIIAYPLVINIAEAKVKSIATNALNQANSSLRAIEAFYGDFFEYHKNNDGDIVLISGNALLINQMNLIAQKEVQEALNTLTSKTVDVPLGAFTGSTVLAGLGPMIPLSLVPIGSTSCQFKSSFQSAGINQTLHKFYIQVTTEIDLVVPLKDISVQLRTELFIGENVIVGKVPETYLNGTANSTYLDLIPR